VDVTAVDIAQLFTDEWWVHGSIYSSPDIFALEQDRIFRRCWLYVAHESEVAEPGDYKTTFAGTQPVIVARGADDGQVRVLLNRCRHRGVAVCQEESGRANYFRCPYHGWTYYNSGPLRGVPYDDAYSTLDRDRLGLVALPRVDTVAGFVFVSFAPEGPTLREYLGNAAPYLERVARSAPRGIRLDVGAHKLEYGNNWKLQIENSKDGYHFGFVHRSFMKVVADRTGQRSQMVQKMVENWRNVDLGNGHSLGEDVTAIDDANRGIVGGLPFNLVIFPNLVIIGSQVRHVLPKKVDRTQVLLYPMVPADAMPEQVQQVLRVHEDFNGPAGAGTVDDMEIAFDRVHDGMQATEQDWVVMSRGMDTEKTGENGTLVGRAMDELPHRAFYRGWRSMMEQTP
jgi:nitrite reductase/ring-hydroxylating ferredoxin subunit